MFPLELGIEVVHEAGVKVLTTQVGVTGSGLHLEDTALDGQKGHIESTATKIEDEDVFFSASTCLSRP